MRALPGSDTRSTQWTDDSLESVHSNEWCTGEDSNLRTSQGGADLQSAGFNHSPTCAETPTASPSLCAQSRADRGRREKIEELNARGNALAQTPHLEKFPYGVPLGNLLCRAALPCVSECFLELAKGFEPLTL